jgi:NADPH:quinone reductase-like Zn-dependent oxidoreductase
MPYNLQAPQSIGHPFRRPQQISFHSAVFSVQTTSVSSLGLWYASPGAVELRSERLLPPDSGQCQVQSLHSAVSRGTESLIFNGLVPVSEYDRMRCPLMGGHFPFPVKYGYCNVGLVTAGPAAWLGQRVFSLSPHQTFFNTSADALAVLPPDLPSKRAVLAANMETALNAVWTAKAGPADRIAVVGGGVIGLLIAYLCNQLPGAKVTVVDPHASRETVCQALGLRLASPTQALEALTDTCDVVFHTSGHPEGLSTALTLAGNEASVIELSWYGTRRVAAPLGEAFHSRQLRLVSCQVGHIEASHRPRWSYGRRLQAALGLLCDARLDALLETAVPFQGLVEHLPRLFSADNHSLCQVIDYS